MRARAEASSSQASIFVRGWRQVPLWLRAVLVGLGVNAVGVGAWVLCTAALPLPWSVPVMAILLWLYWLYFSGRWGGQSTREVRRVRFRATRMSRPIWAWGLAAAALFVVIFQAGLVVSFRIVAFPAERFMQEYQVLDSVPLWIAWPVIVMAALVAGICEETGFRGYMQVPLEKRYGPIAAISVVTVVFITMHLHQAWLAPILIQAVFGSILIALLAYSSGSLIPGMIAHTVMDIFNFSYWWTDVAGRFDKRPIAETGWDAHVLVWIAILTFALTAYLWTLRKLKVLRAAAKSAHVPSTGRRESHPVRADLEGLLEP